VVTVAAPPTRAVGIFKRYGRSFPWVLHDLNLLLEPGSLTEIVGTNGSGKSTLLRVLVGVTRPTRGGVTTRPAAVGYVPERLPARVRMTGRIYLGHMARLRGLDSATANPRVEALAKAFALQPGLDTPVAALSKGNRQKICLAQAFLAPVGLLALDEPWNGLDPTAQAALGHELGHARQAGTAVVTTAHHVGTATGADRTFVLAGGRLEVPARSEATAVTTRHGDALGTDRVGVEIVAPDETANSGDLLVWPGVESARCSGRVWELSVRRDSVDRLLATALESGWSVLRVEPGQQDPALGQTAKS
jgi:ABC-2 type transport system ATP-binding protein